MKRQAILGSLAALTVLGWIVAGSAQTSPPSPGQAALDTAARQGKYAFVLFHKQDDQATQAMRKTLDATMAGRSDQAMSVLVRTTDPAEKPLIDRWGLSRSPMPLVLAVAPNGAITGAFPLKLTEQNVAAAFVSPATAACLRATQARKLVLLCVRPTNARDLPIGVRDFTTDAEYGPATQVVIVQAGDPAEASFLQTLKIQPAATSAVALIVPPGSLLGTFDEKVTKQQFVEKLTNARNSCCPGGKCGPGGCCPGGQCGPKR